MRKCTMIMGLVILALALMLQGAWATERNSNVPGLQMSGDDGGWNDPHMSNDSAADDPETIWGPGFAWSIWMILDNPVGGRMIP